MSHRVRQRGLSRHGLLVGLVLVGAAAATFARLLHAAGLTSLIMWWSCGLVAGLMIRNGWRSGVPIWLGALLASLALGTPLPQALMPASWLAFGGMLLAAWVAWDRAHAGSYGPRFVLASALAMTLPPTLTLASMDWLGWTPRVASPLARWPEWWMHATLATLLIAPAVATISRELLRSWRRRAPALAAAVAVLAVLIVADKLLPIAITQATVMPLAMIAAVIVMLRTDLVFGSLYCLAITMSLILALSPDHPGRFYALVVGGTALLVRLLFEDVRRAGNALRKQEGRQRADALEAVLDERRRIGRDMHDTIGQELTSIALLARLVEQRARAVAPELAPEVATTIQACNRATATARGIARSLVTPRGDA